MKTYYLTIVCIVVTQPLLAGEPSWMKDLPRNSGKNTEVSCHGLGPDKETAYRVMLDQCRSLAGDHLLGKFNISTLSTESEGSVGYHQEVTSNYEVTGLQCKVNKYQEEVIEDTFHTYARCSFDNSAIKFSPRSDKAKESDIKSTSDSQVLNINDRFRDAGLIASENRQVIVSSVPQCTTLIVIGKVTRMIRCKENPQTVVIYPSDKQLLVRANGYVPTHVDLSPNRPLEPVTLEVYLEKN